MIRIINKLKNNELKNIIGIIILSITISSCLFTPVNTLVNNLLPKEEVKITVIENKNRKNAGSEIWITDLKKNVDEDLKFINNQRNTYGIWEYRNAAEYGYIENMLVSYGDNIGSTITIHMLKSPNSSFRCWANSNAGVISVETNGNVSTYDLYSEIPGGEMKVIYPYLNSSLALVLKAFIYLIIITMIFIILYLIYNFIKIGYKMPKALLDYNPKFNTIIILLTIYIYNIIKYINGIPNFLEFGDQVYYWTLNPIASNEDFLTIAQKMVSFRGYLSNLGPYIAQILEKITHIHAEYFYLFFLALVSAFLFGYVIPKIHYLLSGKKPHNYQIILFFLVFSFFWRSLYYTVLMDLVSVTCFFTFIMFVLLFVNSYKRKYAFGAGCAITSAIMYRLNYTIVFTFFCITAIIYVIYLVIKYLFSKKPRSLKVVIINYLKGSIIFLIAVFLLSIPQLIINSNNGHIGLFPYDDKGSWVSEDYSLTDYSASLSFNYLSGYPYPIKDAQINNIRLDNYINLYDNLNVNQILFAYASKPLDAIHTIIKKTFTGFDIKTHIAYPSIDYSFNSYFYIFSMVNYLILGSAIYIIFNNRIRKILISKKEFLLFIITFGILILPQSFVHIEWRYFLPGYILIYYIFAYKLGLVLSNKDFKDMIWKSNYFIFIGPFCILAHMLSLSLYY